MWEKNLIYYYEKMKELKFRAWDWKNMSDTFDFSDISYEWFPDICLDDTGEEIMPHIIFMQYSWLKDKNGKEIYEGDIVNLFPEYDDMKVAYEVLYDWCGFKVNCWNTPYNNNLEEINHKIEIIWNIYENPNLLNK